MTYNGDGIHDEYVAGLSTTLNTLQELTNDDSLPMITVLPAISNGASYRLYGKILWLLGLASYFHPMNSANSLIRSQKDQTFPC